MRSIPTLDGPREELLTPIPGSPPSPLAPPPGCRFHPRCPYSEPEHARTDPALEPVSGQPDHEVACLLDTDTRRRLWTGLGDDRGGATQILPVEDDDAEASLPALAPESAS